jgi:transposase-like protein
VELIQFERLKAAIATQASAAQILELAQVVRLVMSQQVVEVALARRTNVATEVRSCPHCISHDVVLHGLDKNRRQRFKCRACRRTYNILTGTPMARARKAEKWGTYLNFMSDHMSVRDIVTAGIGVHHVTVWRWRHRFLAAAVNDNAALLSGIIEADETFFLRSFKGDHGWKNGLPPENRAARPRAWGATRRDLSDEQVPVLSALDTSGGIYEAMLPSLTGIEAALNGRIAPASVLCSDGTAAYANVADKAGAEHRVIHVPTIASHEIKINPVPTPPRREDRLGLSRVNAHHGRLKAFINGRCRGVATKYLDNYLGWHRAMVRGVAGTALLDRALLSDLRCRIHGGGGHPRSIQLHVQSG